jgi:hypothetical protein
LFSFYHFPGFPALRQGLNHGDPRHSTLDFEGDLKHNVRMGKRSSKKPVKSKPPSDAIGRPPAEIAAATENNGGKTPTAEELECMANAEIAARFNLSNDKLRAFAAKNSLPPEWLKTAEEKPF